MPRCGFRCAVIRELRMFNQCYLNDMSVSALCFRAFLLKMLLLCRLWDYFAVLHARQKPLEAAFQTFAFRFGRFQDFIDLQEVMGTEMVNIRRY